MAKAIITGVSGFAGSHLADYLLANTDWEITGIHRPGDSTRNLEHSCSRIDIHDADTTDPGAIDAIVAAAKPDYIFHLAAQASVPASISDPAATINSNVIGQLNLLEAVVRHAPEARVLVVGSGDEYGMVKPEEVPIAEDQPFRPNSPYAVSKVAQDMLGLQYFLMHKVSTIRVRPFNHIGPRQARGFVVADFARQIAEIEAGACAPVVRVGNLNAERDFTDVRDMVRAYHLAITQGAPGDVYNLGSGATTSIKNMLNDLLSLSSAAIEVVVDPARLRPSDMPVLSCDSTKFRTLTGWTPMISLKQSLQDVLDYWRQAL